MKVKHYLETIIGIEIYPLISLVIFVVFFTLMLIYVLKMDKDKIKTSANLPLDSSESDTKDNNTESANN